MPWGKQEALPECNISLFIEHALKFRQYCDGGLSWMGRRLLVGADRVTHERLQNLWAGHLQLAVDRGRSLDADGAPSSRS